MVGDWSQHKEQLFHPAPGAAWPQLAALGATRMLWRCFHHDGAKPISAGAASSTVYPSAPAAARTRTPDTTLPFGLN